jgi:hypothetical protein
MRTPNNRFRTEELPNFNLIRRSVGNGTEKFGQTFGIRGLKDNLD